MPLTRPGGHLRIGTSSMPGETGRGLQVSPTTQAGPCASLPALTLTRPPSHAARVLPELATGRPAKQSGTLARSAAEQQPDASAARRLSWWAACVSLLPIPIWFIVTAAMAPAPAWRAQYRARTDSSDAAVVTRERELQRYWDKQNPRVPGDLDVRNFTGDWDTCLVLDETRDVAFMLVVDGSATFGIDGVERLRATSGALRATRGEVIRLEPGNHHLTVRLEPRSWPAIALLASFDGKPPRPVGSGQLVSGVRSSPPAEGPEACRPL